MTKVRPDIRFLHRAIYSPALATGKSYTNFTGDKDARDGMRSERAISLLEELFPEELKKDLPRPEGSRREIPRVPLDSNVASAKQNPKRAKTSGSSASAASLEQDGQPTLLILQRASRLLIDADFKRLMPGSKHIEGWTSKGEIVKVLKNPDIATTTRHGTYYLLFNNYGSARAYQENLEKLHKMSKTVSPRYWIPSLSPAAEGNSQRNNSPTTILDYSLIPPFQKLDLQIVPAPFPPKIQQVIDRDVTITGKRDQMSRYEVIVQFKGQKVSRQSLKVALKRDSIDRGITWGTCESDGVRSLEAKPTRSKQMAVDDDASSHEASGKERPRIADSYGSQYLVSFRKLEEAQRFATEWHMREIETLSDESSEKSGVQAIAMTKLVS